MTAFAIAAMTGVMTLGGGMIALWLKASRGLILAFCAGLLMALALLELLPAAMELLESAEHAHHDHHGLLIACALGFISFYLLEELAPDPGHTHRHDHRYEAHPPVRNIGLWGAISICFHSLLDGIALGQGFQAGGKIAWIVAFAVVIHKLGDGISSVGIMLSTKHDSKTTILVLIATAVAPIIGVLLQLAITVPTPLLALMLGWFAGVFIYLAACNLLPASRDPHQARWLPLVTLGGGLFVYIAHLIAE